MFFTRLVKVYLLIQKADQDLTRKKGEPIACAFDMEKRIHKIRCDKGIPDSSEWMVMLSLATKEMIKYISMYSEVWVMDCTAGKFKLLSSKLYKTRTQFY